MVNMSLLAMQYFDRHKWMCHGRYKSGELYPKQASRKGQITLLDIITCSCPWCLLLVQHLRCHQIRHSTATWSQQFVYIDFSLSSSITGIHALWNINGIFLANLGVQPIDPSHKTHNASEKYTTIYRVQQRCWDVHTSTFLLHNSES